MAEIDTQSIPAPLLYLYQGALGAAAMWTQKEYVKKRQPWRINKMQGGGLVVPELTRGWGVTPEQYYVRRIFQRSAYYFNWQTDTGGVVPPAIGPRDKSWWWTASAGSGLIYRNYFMQQTILSLLDGILPDWCKLALTDDASVFEEYPNEAKRDFQQLSLDSRYAGKAIWTFIKFDYFTYWVYMNPNFFSPGYYQPNEATLDFYEIVDAWDPETITWNNKPALGDLVFSIPLPQLGWAWSFMPPEYGSLCIKLHDANQYLVFASSEAAESTYRPSYNPIEGYFGM